MADRSVVVRLKAEVSGFQAAMAASGASAKKMQADLEQMQQNGGTALGRLATSADQHKQAWQASGVALLGFGVAAEAGVGLAVKAFADFSAKMAQVQSLSHASADDMNTLTTAALNMGQSIGFSATEVADAEIELVKAGVSVKDIMGGALAGSLTLAAAGQIDVAQATEISTIAMTQFGLAGKDIPHVADLLAAGADKALGGVSDLGWALKTGGLVAHQFGLSLDDTVGTLALFAQNGLMGEAAGTDLRQMLLKLAAPSKTATADMKSLGMSMYDSQGHFVGIANLAGQLHDKMSKLSESERNAMEAHIFGARAIVGANILYQAGAAGVQDWINNVNDSGFAAKQAAGKMDSLTGDMNKLQAAWGTAMIEMGSTADGFLRPVVQNITGAIRGFEALPESTKGTILGFSAVAGAAALAVGGFLTLAPKVFDTISGFKTLAADMPGVASRLGTLGKAAGVAAGAFAVLAAASAVGNAMAPATSSVDETTQALIGLKKNSSAVDDTFKKLSGQGTAASDINTVGDALYRINHMDLNATVNKWFNDVAKIPDSLKPARDELDKYDQSLSNLTGSGNAQIAADGFKQIASEGLKSGISIETTAKSFPQYIDALRAQASQAKVNVSDQELLSWAMGQVPAAMQAAAGATQTYTDAAGNAVPVTAGQQKALDALGLSAEGVALDMGKLITSFEQAGLIQISADQALNDYHSALLAVDDSIKKNGKTLDVNTAAGIANRKALDDVASAGMKMLDANAKNGAQLPELSKGLKGTYNDLIANYKAFGITGGKADDMARKVLGIPKGVKIDTAIQNYINSMLQLQGLNNAADNLNGKTAVVHVVTSFEQRGVPYSPATTPSGAAVPFAQLASPIPRHAAGGAVFGSGTGTSDDVPAFLSNGEHVLTADEVQKMGGQAAVYRFRNAVDKGVAPKFAAGGAADRRQYINDQAYALRLDDTRGQSFRTVPESLSNAYSFSDRLRSAATSGNLPSQRSYLLNTASHSEDALRRLYAQSDKLTASLDKAKQRLTDLTQVQGNVASTLRGEFSIGAAIGSSGPYGVANIADVQAQASTKLNEIKAFALKLKRLQRMGYSGAIVQEVAGLGSAQGGVAADALIAGSGSQVKQLNSTYTAMDTASATAGAYVTNSMFKGGVSVAEGIVKGLESQESAITRAMTKVGLSMEKALKKALGINSPSRVATDITDNFTGTIIDRQKAALNPIGAHAAAIGHAMVPSKSLFGGTGSIAYQPSAPSYRGAPNYRAASTGTGSVTNVWNITGQENPVATSHEVSRRFTALKV